MKRTHTLFVYTHGTSLLHTADPRIKLCAFIVWQLLLWNGNWYAILLLAAILYLVYRTMRISFFKTMLALRILCVLALFTIVSRSYAALQHNSTPLHLQTVLLTAGANSVYAVRLMLTALTAHLMTVSTSRSAWMHTVAWLTKPLGKLGTRITIMCMLTLTFVEVIQRERLRIVFATLVRLRAKKRSHTLLRIRHQCVALVIRLARNVDSIAIALAVRRYHKRRNTAHFSRYPSTLRLILWMLGTTISFLIVQFV